MLNVDLTLFLFQIFLSTFIILCIKYYLDLKNTFKGVPKPFHIPILGTAHYFIGKNYLKVIEKMKDKLGNRFFAFVGPYPFYVTSDPGDLKIVMNDYNSMSKMQFYDFFEPVLGRSLLTAPVDIWKKKRKTLSRSFNQTVLDNFVNDHYEKSCVLVDILSNTKQNNLLHTFEKYTFDSFTKTGVGIDLDIQRSEKSSFLYWITVLQDIGVGRIFQPWYYPDFIFFNSPLGRSGMKMVHDLNNYVREIIKEKRIIYRQNKKEIHEEVKYKAIMDLLLEMEDEGLLSEDELISELNLMAGAATDTAASTMSFACVLLAMHPEIQEKVYQEVVEAVGLDRDIGFEDLPKLKYIERVLNETMRIFPAVPAVGRLATSDVDLGHRVIPKDTNIVLLTISMHRDPNIYKDPLKFDPDRFLPEEISKRPPYSFLPFSGGPRNCIGLKYAYMIMKTALANVVRNFKISCDYKDYTKINLISTIIMTSKDPLQCTFTKRKV